MSERDTVGDIADMIRTAINEAREAGRAEEHARMMAIMEQALSSDAMEVAVADAVTRPTLSRLRRDRPGLTSNACFLRILRRLVSGEALDLSDLDGKTARQGITAGWVVREGYAAYIYDGGPRAVGLRITDKGIDFVASVDGKTERAPAPPDQAPVPVPAPVLLAPAPVPAEVEEAAPTFTPIAAPEPPRIPESELVDAATLEPLTRIQFAVFSIMVAAKGEWLSTSKLAEKANNGGAPVALYALVKKGYLRARDVGQTRKAYDVACFGSVRIMNVGAAYERAIVPHMPEPPPAPVEAPVPPAPLLPPLETTTGKTIGPVLRPLAPAKPEPKAWKPLPADEVADLDDLTKSTTDVLLALSATGDNATVQAITAFSETDPTRVPGALTRIAELRLASMSGNKWSLTDAGHSMVLAVKKDQAENG